MSDWLNDPRSDYARLTIPTIWVAFALSLVFHAALLWGWVPRVQDVSLDSTERGTAGGPLVLQLAPPPGRAPSASPAPPASSSAPQASPAKRAPQSAAMSRPPPRTPVITQPQPAPAMAAAPATPPAVAPAQPPVEGDFFSNLEARRRARGEPPAPPPAESASAEPVEDERARHNRIVAANLGLSRTPTFGPDPTGGGVFQIQRMSSDHAEFVFFGWNKDIRRNSKQLIEVRKGDNADIRIAVVRRMITIIRDHEAGDFTWVSQRQGRNITLSARMRDNAGLEDFMLQEFFAGPGRPY